MPTVHKTKRPWIKEKPKEQANESRGGNEETNFYRLSKWRGIRKYVLYQEPLCRSCMAAVPKRLTPATMVDHIVPVKQGGDKYELSNLAPICSKCHARKSAGERKDRSKS